jgi:hypothetical protein
VEIEYKTTNYRDDKEVTETQSVASFLYDELLYQEKYDSLSKEKIRLEDQPKVVCEALGRLVERLLDKNVLNLEDLKHISQCDWGRKADSLALKKGE